MIKHGADYKPSREFQAINQFSAVSITKGEQLAKATGSRYYRKHQTGLGNLALKTYDKFISAHKSAQELVQAYREGKITGVNLQEALGQMAKDVKASLKEMRRKGGTFSGSEIDTGHAEIPSAEEYIRNAQADDENLKENE